MPSFPMLCEARHTLHFGLLRAKVKRSPGWVLARAAADGGSIRNSRLAVHCTAGPVLCAPWQPSEEGTGVTPVCKQEC